MLRDFDPDRPVDPSFTSAVSEEIDRFLDSQGPLMAEVGTSQLMAVARRYTGGGKRLRPAYCYWAHVAAGGRAEDRPAVLQVASSLDVLHASALVHDDLIDAADTRRGHPAAHRQLAELHRERTGSGDPDGFGSSAAVLVGDMLMMWSVAMFDASRAPNLEEARPDMAAMRAEVTAGQFLDVSASYGVADSRDELAVARAVLEYKSASYSIRRPALIGAALAGADELVQDALGTFGSHVGHAFQLRDDVLGIWGDADVTGKPTGGDLREGKATVLVLTALEAADDRQRSVIQAALGNKAATDEEVTRAAEAIEACGARTEVERMIDEHLRLGLGALTDATLTDEGRTALNRLAEASTRRAF